MNKTCGIFNSATHYRASIYKLLDKELHCDFYFGDKGKTPNKKINYDTLFGFKKELKNIYIFKIFYWQKGAVKTIFSDYKNYIITGDPFCLSTWVIILFARMTSKKTYLWTHGWYGRENKVKGLIKKAFFGLSNHVLLYGEYARNLMIKEGFNADKLHCIYNSLDYDTQVGIRKRLKKTSIFRDKFGNENPVLCYVGRIQKSKRLDMIIKSMIILKKKYHKSVNLIIVGKENEETGIVKLVEHYDLSEHVWFYGPSYDETELGTIFYNASICVSPGNVGLTAIHSLTYGCPLITHSDFKNQMPEFESITPPITGVFFEKDNIDDLALKINDWLITHPNHDNINREKCYEVIDEKYNPHYQINLLKSLITGNN